MKRKESNDYLERWNRKQRGFRERLDVMMEPMRRDGEDVKEEGRGLIAWSCILSASPRGPRRVVASGCLHLGDTATLLRFASRVSPLSKWRSWWIDGGFTSLLLFHFLLLSSIFLFFIASMYILLFCFMSIHPCLSLFFVIFVLIQSPTLEKKKYK